MHATQPSTFGDSSDLFASLQTVHATVQEQTERFHYQLALVKDLASRVQDGARVELLGDVSLSLHRVHTLLFGGIPEAPEQATSGLPVAAESDMQTAFAEFSALLSASQGTAQQVDALLAQTDGQLALLQAVEA